MATETSVTIISPVEGMSVAGGSVQVQFRVSNWEIVSGGRHLHWFLDGVDKGPHYSTQPIEVSGLAAGTHTITLQLAEADHQFTDYADSVSFTVTTQSATPTPVAGTGCDPDVTPVGALATQPKTVFCRIGTSGAGTEVAGANSWLDDFNHGLSFASFGSTNYTLFDGVGFVYKTIQWRHADHWMVDVATKFPQYQAGWNRGGAMLRPNKTFTFENGKLVVEADAAAGIAEYVMNAWPEIVISTGSQPVDTGSLYAYDDFPESFSLGCRLQDSRYPVCSFKINNGSVAEKRASERIWEISAHQQVGTTNFGGFPDHGREKYWRSCSNVDPDTLCRDRFRLELTPTTLTLYVNAEKYFEQTGLPTMPSEFVNGNLYVYFASMVTSHQAEAVRFHWDRAAVNPGTPPSASPTFGNSTGY